MSTADGSVQFEVGMDTKKAQAELNSLERKVNRLNTSIYNKQQERLPLVKQFEELTVQLDAAKAKLAEMQASPRGTYSTDAIAEQKERVALLQSEWNKVYNRIDSIDRGIERQSIELQTATAQARKLAEEMATGKYETAETSYEMGTTADQAQKASQELGSSKSKTDGLSNSLETAAENARKLKEELGGGGTQTRETNDELERTPGKLDKITTRLKNMASRVFVFSMITSALRSLRTWLGNVIEANDETSAALSKLKGALLTLVQPIVNVLIPAFTTLLNVLTKVVSTAAGIVSRIFGTTAEASAEAAESLYNQTNAMESAGSAAKDASKSMAGFDEINQLSGSGDSDSGGGTSSSSGSTDPTFDDEDGISAVTQLLVGIGLVALGAILLFSGASVPLGLGMIVAGGMMVWDAISENWNEIQEALQGPLGVIVAMVSAALLVLGAVLVFTGAAVPLGLGLLIAGAAGLAATIAANWDTISEKLQGPIGVVAAIVSAALLVLGAILAFTGAALPLGIGLLVVGAAGLAATIAANWNTIKEKLQGPIGKVAGIVSTAFLVLGAILAFTGAALPLGIGLLVVGAVGLATTIAANWNTIKEKLQGPIGVVAGIVSAALLVLGAILAFTGAALPLGIGLLVVGAAGLVTVVALNWNTIKEKLQGPIGVVAGIVSAALLVLGAILAFSGVALPLGIALMIAGAAGLVTVVALNWDAILEKLKDVWESVKNWWNTSVSKYFTADFWKELGKKMLNGLLESIENGLNNALTGAGSFVNKIIGVLNKIPGVDIDTVSWGNVKLPRLAEGAVIPPNKEFLAVLGDQKSGTNVEAPLSTIEQAVENVLRRMGYSTDGGDTTVILELDKVQFAKAVYTANKSETNRIGLKLSGV